MADIPYYRAEPGEGEDTWCDLYDMLKGPNGFECLLTEPEDRTWYRDGSVVIDELNRLYVENERLQARIADLEAALETISKYGDGSICPYGCDTPDIASAALAAKENGNG